METVRSMMVDMETFSDLIADAILKKTHPVKDDLTERQARAAYGTRWLRQMREQGLADVHRVGHKIIYSRHQLDCLRAAERRHAEMVINEAG